MTPTVVTNMTLSTHFGLGREAGGGGGKGDQHGPLYSLGGLPAFKGVVLYE